MLPTDFSGRVSYLKLAGPDVYVILRRAATALALRKGDEDYLRQALSAFVARFEEGAGRNVSLALDAAFEVIESRYADPVTQEWLISRAMQYLPAMPGEKWSWAFIASLYAPRGSALEDLAVSVWERRVIEKWNSTDASSVLHSLRTFMKMKDSLEAKGAIQPNSLAERRASALIDRILTEMHSPSARSVVVPFRPRPAP